MRTAQEMGFDASGVPVTIIGDRHWIGWSDTVRDEVLAEVERTLAPDPEPAPETDPAPGADGRSATVDVPLVGEVTVRSDSLVLATLVIAFVDGVNPCSLWVISVLLAIVVRTASRGRVLAIGGTFLVVTAAMYAVYVAGIYPALSVVGHLGSIHVVVALVAGLFGLVSIKDYFAFRQGLSFTIKDSSKPGIYARMRAAVTTMRAARMQERHGRLLKLVAGTLMLALAVTVVVNPEAMNSPLTALLVFAGAFAVAGATHLVTTSIRGQLNP